MVRICCFPEECQVPHRMRFHLGYSSSDCCGATWGLVTSHTHIAYTFNPGLRRQNKQLVERKMSLQSHFLHQERLGSSPLFSCWYTAPKQRLTRKFLSGLLKEFSQQIFSNNLFKLKCVISYAGIQCYQGSSAPWERAAAWYRPSSNIFHAISSFPAFFVFYLQQFAAIPGQYFVITGSAVKNCRKQK